MGQLRNLTSAAFEELQRRALEPSFRKIFARSDIVAEIVAS